jgi:diguanylate cyclase (GGDEF)-like protein
MPNRKLLPASEPDPGPATPLVTSQIRSLEQENRQLRIRVRRLQQLAFVDCLTGLPNRRHFEETLNTEIRRACRTRTPLSLAICDVDFFKDVNDALGHAAGDAVLRGLGRILMWHCRRGGDFAARYGGEEFALLMPGIDAREIVSVADRVRTDIAATALPCGEPKRSTRVTVSIGAASFVPEVPYLPETLLGAADVALYQAKRAGRNRVCYEPIHSA